MPDNHSVGRPNNNTKRMEPRSVPVQKDQARLNDERKVRPHTAGTPPMGVRPHHPGAQKEPKAPSDKLAGNYIQAREVPMATMTEAELAEWNPLDMFRSKPNPRVANIVNKYGPKQPGSSGSDPRIDQIEDRLNRLTVEIARLSRANQNQNQNAKPVPSPTPQARPSPGGTGPEDYSIDRPVASVKTPFGNKKPQWPSNTGPRPGQAQPAQKPASNGGGMPFMVTQAQKQRLSSLGYSPDEIRNMRPEEAHQIIAHERMHGALGGSNGQGNGQDVDMSMADQLLSAAKPEFYTPARLAAMSSLNKTQAIRKLKMSGGGVREGYPDTSYEKCEPAHQSRIGDLGWKGRQKQPGVPGLNRNFIQARDIPVDKVTEHAERDMDDMIARMVKRLGLSEEMHPVHGQAAPAGGPEVDHITLPAYWASALVNGDFSSLDDHEADQARMAMHKLATEGWEVVDVARDENGEGHDSRFSWNYQTHAPHSQYRGGDVMDYVIHRQSHHASQPAAQPAAAPAQFESKLPRVRARW